MVATRRVNFNVETAQFESWQSWSAASGLTLTELLTTGMALLQEAYTAQAAGGQLLLTTADGQCKVFVLPNKSLKLIDAAPTMREMSSAPADTASQQA
jgi:hypothetical protein